MSIKIIGGGSDLNTTINTSNDNFRDIIGDQQTRIIRDDQGTRVVMLDKNGLKTTVPGSGVDVFTASDSQLTFNSARNQLKIVLTGTIAISKLASITSKSVVVTHNLGFIPYVIAAYNTGNPTANGFLPKSTLNLSTGSVDLLLEVQQSTSIDVTFSIRTPSGGSFYTTQIDASIKYYLLQETAV